MNQMSRKDHGISREIRIHLKYSLLIATNNKLNFQASDLQIVKQTL